MPGFSTARLILTFLRTATALLPLVRADGGPAEWISPTPATMVAECYPLSIAFTSAVAPKSISFYYYTNTATPSILPVPIASWPESMWVNTTTVFTAQIDSVPIAAGTMITLMVSDWSDQSVSYDHQSTVQPNTDPFCITSQSQYGLPEFNDLPILPASTTVSPPSSSVAPSPGLSSADSSSTSSAGSSTSSVGLSTSSATPSGTPSILSVPTAKKSNRAGIIAGATIAALAGLALAAAAGIWFSRHQPARDALLAEKSGNFGGEVVRNPTRNTPGPTYIAENYVPSVLSAPAPIQEVDGGAVPMQEPERLPPQYNDMISAASSGRSEQRPVPGNGKVVMSWDG
ncbi:hypothetical protein K438DRAFT_1756675 [Mycena galopus ATCC 62051]|nr:hypothetical protein K438DRAFT_1756675 [Mycena galopus ATCC 62051]